MSLPPVSIQLTANTTQAQQAVTQVAGSLTQVNAAAQQTAGAMAQLETRTSSSSMAIRNASYQISDFVTQVNGGQNAAIALGQQLPQLLVSFGTLGAVLGLVASFTPAIIALFQSSGQAKDFADAFKDVGDALKMVGQTSREFDMTAVYEEFNKATAAAREGMVAQIDFQAELIKTRQLAAERSLQDKSIKKLGIYEDLGLPSDDVGTVMGAVGRVRTAGDAMKFMTQYGATLAASTSPVAQALVKDMNDLAQGGREAAAALERLAEARDKMVKAGAGGQIEIPGKPEKPPKVGTGRTAAEKVNPFEGLHGFDDNRSAREVMQELHAADRAEEAAIANQKRADESLAALRGRYVDMIDPLKKYSEQLDIIDALEAVGAERGLSAEQAMQARAKVQDQVTQALEGTNDALKDQKNLARDLGMSFSSAFEDAIVGGKKLSDVLQGLGQDIIRIATRKGITEPLGEGLASMFKGSGASDMLKTAGSSASSALKTAGSSLWEGLKSLWPFADGGVMTSSGPLPLRAYASGGIANSPQMALYGEGSRPEAYVPLPDGRTIPVTMTGNAGNAAPPINIVVNNTAAPDVQATATARNNGSGFDIEVLVAKAMRSDMARNGPITQGFGAIFGLRRSV